MFCDRRTLDRPAGEGLGSALAASGFETWLVDFRGHGDAGPPISREVDASYDDVILRDIPAAIRAVHARAGGLPLFLLGHSLGGHGGAAALAVDRSLPVAGLVSLAGNVWIRSLEPDPIVWAAKRAQVELWMTVTRLHGFFPARRYRMGIGGEGISYVRQFARNTRLDRWGSIDGRHDYLRLLSHVTLPILSVASTGDTRMCTPLCARLWLDHAVRAEVTHRVVGERLGDPTGIGHMEVVLDPAMRPIWDEIAAWMVAQIS